jgi:VanZ family protein
LKPLLSATQYGWLALGILVLTVYGSLIPFQFQAVPFDEAIERFQGMSYIDPSLLEARGDWVVSALLFVTLSYLTMAALSLDRAQGIRLRTTILVLSGCIALSVLVEFVQVFFPPRTVSLNDIVVESLGALAGACLWLVCGQRLNNWLGQLMDVPSLDCLAARLLPCYFLLLLVGALMPFDFVVGQEELWAKYQQNRIWLIPFHYGSQGLGLLLFKVLVNAACFLPLGFFWGMAYGDRAPAPSSVLRIALLGLAASTLIEFLQLFVYSRYCDTTDIITGTIAVVGGARLSGWCRDWLQERKTRLWTLGRADFRTRRMPVWLVGSGVFLLVAWLGVLLFVNWAPFDFTSDPLRFTIDSEELSLFGLRRMSWLPLVDYYWGSKYQAFDQFVKKSSSLLPLGVVLAVYWHDVSWTIAARRVLGAALVVSVALAVGKYFLPERYPSTTDMLIQCFGAWLGFTLTSYLWHLLRVELRSNGQIHEFCG